MNLTTDPRSEGHGLDHGGHVVTRQESAILASRGFTVPAGTVHVDKRAVRITIKLPSADPALKAWWRWSRSHCEPGYAERLEKAAGCGGRKAKTWYLYFGIIPPAAFTAIDVLKPAKTGDAR